MKLLCSFLAPAAMLGLTVSAQAHQPACPAQETAKAEIERTIHDFFDALRTDDEASFKRLVTPTFYAFDVGKRFDGSALAEALRDAHARGVQITWTLGPIDTKVHCDVAWAAWENVGSAGIPPDLKPVRWLESAVIIHESEGWKIDLFHSQRAAEK